MLTGHGSLTGHRTLCAVTHGDTLFSGQFSGETMGKPMGFPNISMFLEISGQHIFCRVNTYGYGSTAIKNINVNGRGMCVQKLFWHQGYRVLTHPHMSNCFGRNMNDIMILYNSAAVAILRWKSMTRGYGSSAMVLWILSNGLGTKCCTTDDKYANMYEMVSWSNYCLTPYPNISKWSLDTTTLNTGIPILSKTLLGYL